MKVKEIMERAGIGRTGRAIAYIKDALEEINMISETHVQNSVYKVIPRMVHKPEITDSDNT